MAGNLQKDLENLIHYNFNGKLPKLGENVFVAPGVKLIGDVRLKAYSNVWFNSVLRGDINFIEVGEYTNIQDLCLVHVTKELPAIIGNYVTIGHNAVIHACTIKDNVLIGMNSVVLDGAEISENCIVAAGAVVTPNSKIPSGSLVAGVPAKIIRQLTDNEISQIHQSALNYVEYANQMKNSLSKETL
ncbi:MAG: gamma carbonic anhydrase family protein [Ignavibacteria bacterium]|nr:gamma carbonic anhydrase family protein [Ignavibacteria bacterium]